MTRCAPWQRDLAAVSDVLGNILLVGITVVTMSGLAGIVLALEGPAQRLRPDLEIRLQPGPGGWGDGDESIQVRHLGGDALPRDRVRITISVAGEVTSAQGAALQGGFDDGRLTTGDTWQWSGKVPQEVPISVDLVDLEAKRIIVSFQPAGGS